MREELVVIDPQVDFCDPQGSLYVQGADEDMNRLATFIRKRKEKLSAIHVTLDSHPRVHIAHPVFWKDSKGRHPQPFTIITHGDVKSGAWTPARPSLTRWALDYTGQLEKNQRYPLCIWPEHCLIGSPGHAVAPSVFEAMNEWAGDLFRTIDFVVKGSNPYTEHYSAIKADVEHPEDPQNTGINFRFLQVINEADIIYLAGEAGSHCLANTGRDMIEYFDHAGYTTFIQKLVLLEDATSPVAGFEQNQADFIQELSAKGMRVTTTVDAA